MRILAAILAATLWVPVAARAQDESSPVTSPRECSAHYRFDGNLADSGGNGYDGEMFGAEGVPATPRYTDGVDGQALALDGSSVMMAYLDLHPDRCPQFTISGWVRLDPEVSGTRWVIGTGGGGRPGLLTSGRIATLGGSGNGLSERDAVRDSRAWFFFAGVYDYPQKNYRFHWRERSYEGTLPDSPPEPDDVLWVGARNDRLSYALENAAIDDLRIVGRALTAAEIEELRGGRRSALIPGAETATTASAISGNRLTPLSGSTDRFGSTAPRVSAEDLPERPPLLPDGGFPGTSDDDESIELREDPRAATGVIDPDLTVTGPDPAGQLEEELELAQEAGFEAYQEQRIQEYENSFGPRNRTQVVLTSAGEVAYASTPDRLLFNDVPNAVDPNLLDSLTPTLNTGDLPGAVPGITPAGPSLDPTPDIREVLRFQGSDAYMIVRANGDVQVLGDARGYDTLVRGRIDWVVNNARPVDLVADWEGRFLLVSGTSVWSQGISPAAPNWARAELAKSARITAFTFLPGNAWIGVSELGVHAEGLTASHWATGLKDDLDRLVAAGEEIHDISIASSSTSQGSWAIATDRRIYLHQAVRSGKRFPACRDYQRSNDDLRPAQKRKHEFGQTITAELGHEWECWYPQQNCLAKYPTWSDTDMGSPADDSEWLVNLMVTVGVPMYSGIEKEIVDCWLADQMDKAEDIYVHKPSLKFRVRTEHRTSVDGVDLSDYWQPGGSAHAQFMDDNFDIQAKSKTEGFFPILVTNELCIGYEDDGRRHCIAGRATFPHFVKPFNRKHGIILKAETGGTAGDLLAHEFGHYLSLKHTFEPYGSPIGDLNCNQNFTPKGSEVRCNSCQGTTSGGTCSSVFNVMDYCDGDRDDARINYCQQVRAVNQRQRYLTNDGQTKYSKMNGRLGEPYCRNDSDCLDDEYCNTGILTLGANYCRTKLASGAACSRGGQCESGRCPFLTCR